jgi:hypothetical protein
MGRAPIAPVFRADLRSPSPRRPDYPLDFAGLAGAYWWLEPLEPSGFGGSSFYARIGPGGKIRAWAEHRGAEIPGF